MSFLVILSLQMHNLWKSFSECVVCVSGQLFLGIFELWILWKMSFIASEKWGHNSVWQVIFAFICNTIVLFMFLGTHWFQPVPIWHWEVHNCGEMVLWNFGDQWVYAHLNWLLNRNRIVRLLHWSSCGSIYYCIEVWKNQHIVFQIDRKLKNEK